MSQYRPTYTPTEYRYQQIADHIQARIDQGELGPGDQLPAEYGLAEQYGTSPYTVRRALKELRERQRVITLPGKGTFVRRHPRTEGAESDVTAPTG